MSNLRTRLATGALALAIALTGAACSGGKPSKAEYEAALTKMMGTELSSLDKAIGEKYIKCITDKSYDKLSAEAITALIKDDKSYKGSDADSAALISATMDCTKEIIGG